MVANPESLSTDPSDGLARLRRRVGGLHSDQQGQSIVYMVMVMFLLACFTFMVINSGNLVHDKMQLQSAADASALSGTTWVARATAKEFVG